MKYFVIADVHGFFNEMKKALDEAGFDENNPNHTLVSCGDVIDRGRQPIEVMKYLLGLPRKILIKGNHEDSLRSLIRKSPLDEFEDEHPSWHNFHNGTVDTAIALASSVNKIAHYYPIVPWTKVKESARKEPTFREYMKQTVDYFETENYVFVHSWIPTKFAVVNGVDTYIYDKNWRKSTKEFWKKTRWFNGIKRAKQNIYEPGKTIVCGHIHAAMWHEEFEGVQNCHEPYITDKVIALDTCTVLTKKVNVIVLED